MIRTLRAAGVQVVAAFYPLAEAVRQVGGDDVRVDDLTPAGAEPHDLELTTRQVDDLEDADLVVAMGHDFQPALEDIAERRDADGTLFVLDELPIDAGDKSVEDSGSNALDPHVWLDPELMQEIVADVASSLASSRSRAGGDVHRERAAVLGMSLPPSTRSTRRDSRIAHATRS